MTQETMERPVGASVLPADGAAAAEVPAAIPVASQVATEGAEPVAPVAPTAPAAASAPAADRPANPAAPTVPTPAPPAAPRMARGTFHVPPRDDTVAAPAPGGRLYHTVKRAFDLLFSLVVLIIGFIPGLILCAIICIDSPGRPFFRQERVGLRGRTIRIFKFRTMVSDAHAHPERYMTPEQLAVWQREQKIDHDPRITRVGRFLRAHSIDEFPQFINVLTGDLSVIGPRPVTEEETLEFGNGREEFLSVKPGITGWWQVTARNDATWEDGERQMLELFYVRHASLALDARVFVRTFKVMAEGQGK